MSALLGAALLAAAPEAGEGPEPPPEPPPESPAVTGPAAHVLFGEALIEQSSGRHRPQVALQLAVGGPLREVGGVFTLGLGGELLLTTAADRSELVAVDQHVARAAVLATVTFARPAANFTVETRKGVVERRAPRLAFDLAAGPATIVTAAVWSSPELDPVVLVEPGARGRAGLELGLGPHLSMRGQGGLAWRPSGFDHDYAAGVAWAW